MQLHFWDNNWTAEVNESDSNYNVNASDKFNISLDVSACTASINVYEIIVPNETFQYKNFTVNATIRSQGGSSSDVYTNISVPSGWGVGNQNTIYRNYK